MSIGNRQIGWSNESNLLWEIGKKLERLIQVAGPAQTTTTSTTSLAPALHLTIVANYPVVDPSDVSLWNTLLGSSFSSVDIIGVDIYLRGGSPFNMLASALNFSELVVIDDQINSVLSVSTDSLANNPILNVIKLPALTSIDDVTSFTNSGTGVDVYATVYLPNCTSIGPTVGDDGVFLNVFTFGGATITITIPASLMTCDAGNPDGDIQFLQANNTVIVVTV